MGVGALGAIRIDLHRGLPYIYLIFVELYIRSNLNKFIFILYEKMMQKRETTNAFLRSFLDFNKGLVSEIVKVQARKAI